MNDIDKNNFKQLMTLIGENYNSEFSIVKIKLWWDLLKSYEYQDLHNAVYKHMLESSFVPKPADLIKLMEPDYVEMFNRLIGRGEYKNTIERVTWNAVGYSCRTQLSEKDAIARFKSEYKRQVELSKQPRTPQTHQIEHQKEVKPTDKMVDEGVNKYKGKSKEEVKAMLEAFKANCKMNSTRGK